LGAAGLLCSLICCKAQIQQNTDNDAIGVWQDLVPLITGGLGSSWMLQDQCRSQIQQACRTRMQQDSDAEGLGEITCKSLMQLDKDATVLASGCRSAQHKMIFSLGCTGVTRLGHCNRPETWMHPNSDAAQRVCSRTWTKQHLFGLKYRSIQD
jgi:hypothetical protein